MNTVLIGISYLAVLALGVYLGMVIMALCVAAKKGDDDE